MPYPNPYAAGGYSPTMDYSAQLLQAQAAALGGGGKKGARARDVAPQGPRAEATPAAAPATAAASAVANTSAKTVVDDMSASGKQAATPAAAPATAAASAVA